ARLRGGVPHHDDVVDWSADPERLHRRVPDPAGRLREEHDLGGVCGQRRRPGRGLHAVSLSADDVRTDREPEERTAARPRHARIRDVRAAAGARGVDGPVSGAVSSPARHLGGPHHGAGESAVRAGLCDGLRRRGFVSSGFGRHTAWWIAGLRRARHGSRTAGHGGAVGNGAPGDVVLPDRDAVRTGRQTPAQCRSAAIMPAGIALSDFYYILPEIVLTVGALLVLVADVLL